MAEGRLAEDDPRHGTQTAYNRWGCRCPRCRQAHTEYLHDQRQKRAQLAEDDPRHGTRAGYTNWRCSCDRCRQANAEYLLDYMHRNLEQQKKARVRGWKRKNGPGG